MFIDAMARSLSSDLGVHDMCACDKIEHGVARPGRRQILPVASRLRGDNFRSHPATERSEDPPAVPSLLSAGHASSFGFSTASHARRMDADERTASDRRLADAVASPEPKAAASA